MLSFAEQKLGSRDGVTTTRMGSEILTARQFPIGIELNILLLKLTTDRKYDKLGAGSAALSRRGAYCADARTRGYSLRQILMARPPA